MKLYLVEMGYAFRGVEEVLDRVKMFAEDKLDLVKKIRRRFYTRCYNDKNLVEWIESSDNWDRQVDDEFLLDLICDGENGKDFGIMLAEDIYFDCVELEK
jgi:hypothetical protein